MGKIKKRLIFLIVACTIYSTSYFVMGAQPVTKDNGTYNPKAVQVAKTNTGTTTTVKRTPVPTKLVPATKEGLLAAIQPLKNYSGETSIYESATISKIGGAGTGVAVNLTGTVLEDNFSLTGRYFPSASYSSKENAYQIRKINGICSSKIDNSSWVINKNFFLKDKIILDFVEENINLDFYKEYVKENQTTYFNFNLDDKLSGELLKQLKQQNLLNKIADKTCQSGQIGFLFELGKHPGVTMSVNLQFSDSSGYNLVEYEYSQGFLYNCLPYKTDVVAPK